MIDIDTTNMCSHLQRKLFEEDGIYHPFWLAMQNDPERTEQREPSELARRWPSRDGRRQSQLTVVVRSRQLHIYRNSKKVLVLAGKAAPKIIREDAICELINKQD